MYVDEPIEPTHDLTLASIFIDIYLRVRAFISTLYTLHPPLSLSAITLSPTEGYAATKRIMDIDDDDDFYAPEEPTTHTDTAAPADTQAASIPTQPQQQLKQQDEEDLEEGEEEDEGADMDEDDSVCPMLQ